ncbi:eukaryotic translation initiation factor 4E-like [Adelges cooleyi]|uniref:eukaryotic translation initiation factor 4E-like n=1 Tax=Adelges cooleyi TaxID=133065 RepID=UPI0021803950|nr:eukaryotic translation initiation factor 4E-like [Adelges cooleyi]XP_050433235.1 eukaryotic translation initiation factor 4E-like [Adelges cooleyi]XP_050433236.1 eukaryotic translation initiation factor 4E-like [Adelges cooleyi]
MKNLCNNNKINAEMTENSNIDVHLLRDSWKLWYWKFNTVAPLDWIDNLNGLCEFDSVEKFWSIFNHIKMPSTLKIGCDYSVFKTDIKPMWEDKSNKNGGRWLIKDNGMLDQYWMDLLMSMIGGMYEPYNDNICGIVYNRRQYSKLSIWISTCEPSVVNDIGSKLKDYLNVKERIVFEKHSDTSTKKKSTPFITIPRQMTL